MPLILTRRRGETIAVDGPCLFRFLDFHGGRMTVEITAESGVTIVRGELLPGHIRLNRPAKKVNGKWRYPKRSDE